MTSGERTSTITEVLSYDIHYVTAATRTNIAATGSTSVTISGVSYGHLGRSMAARLGDTAMEETIWVSDTSINSKSGVGARGTLRMVVTAGSHAATLTEAVSYEHALILSSVKTKNYPLEGGTSMTVFGGVFSPQRATLSVRMGDTVCEATDWSSSYTEILCKPVRGSRGTRRVTLTAGLAIASITEMYSFDSIEAVSATVEDTVRGNLNPRGETVVQVVGITKGLWDHSIAARLDGTACENTIWQSDTSLSCKTARGAIGTRRFTVTSGVRAGSMTEMLTYDGPETTAVVHADTTNLVLAGGKVLTFRGTSFGTFDSTSAARAGQTACEATVWASETTVSCQTPAGVRTSKRVVVTSGERTSTITEVLSYDIHYVTAATRTNIAATGSTSVTISGVSYGHLGRSMAARLGDTAMEETIWVSDTSINSKSGVGARGTLRMVVTAGSHAATLTEAVSYEHALILSSVKTKNYPLEGGTSMTVFGGVFSPQRATLSVRMGDTVCEATDWSSSYTEILCKPVRGSRGTRRVTLTAGLAIASITEMYSFDSIEAVSATVEDTVRGNLNPRGETVVQVVGITKGLWDHSIAARLDGTACENTIWQSDTSLSCKTARGAIGTRRFTVTSGVRAGSMTEMLTYDGPETTAVVHADTTNLVLAGGKVLTFRGTSFGTFDSTSAARAGQTACEATVWASETTVSCQTPAGVRTSKRVVVTSGERTSTITEVLSYDIHYVTAATRTNIAATGSTSVTISGVSYGHLGRSMAARLGDTAMEETIWVSDTSINSKSGVGARGTLRMVVTAGSHAATLTEALSYNGISLDSISRTNFLHAGNEMFTITGDYHDRVQLSTAARFAQTATESTEWNSDESIKARTPTGARGSRGVTITVGLAIASISEVVTYDGPDSTSIQSVNRPGTAATDASVVLHATGLGLEDLSLGSRLGGTTTERSVWASDTALSTRFATSGRSTHRVVVTSGERVASLTESYTFDAPVLRSPPSTANLATRGQGGDAAVAVLLGAGLLHGGLSGAARAGGTSCEQSEWASDSSVQCRIARGAHSCRRLTVTAGERAASATEAFSFDAAVLSSVDPANGAPPGGDTLTLTGGSLGRSLPSASARLGATATEITVWLSDTAALARNTVGMRASRSIQLTAGQRAASLSEAFSYDVIGLTAIAPVVLPTTGSVSVTFLGAKFGFFDLSTGMNK